MARYGRAMCSLDLSDKFSPFVNSLLSMDKRIRLCPLFGDVEEDKGFFITKKHIYIPYSLPKVEHDLAHLVEMNAPRRWTMPDWGLPRFEKDVMPAGQVFAALSRECRTRAIQLHMETFPSEEAKFKSTSWSQLNNFYWADLVKSVLPFGRFKNYRDVEDWNAMLRERTFKAWSLERIRHAWEVRLNHIQHWMETANGAA